MLPQGPNGHLRPLFEGCRRCDDIFLISELGLPLRPGKALCHCASLQAAWVLDKMLPEAIKPHHVEENYPLVHSKRVEEVSKRESEPRGTTDLGDTAIQESRQLQA